MTETLLGMTGIVPFEEVVDRAVDVINKGLEQKPEIDVASLTDYSQMKEKLAMEVVSAEANKDLLETIPHGMVFESSRH